MIQLYPYILGDEHPARTVEKVVDRENRSYSGYILKGGLIDFANECDVCKKGVMYNSQVLP